jgi:indole-3-glycerol phosphate synthase
MASILEQIVSQTGSRITAGVSYPRHTELEKMDTQDTPRGFRWALLASDWNRPAVIAELKKASPSRGLVRGSLFYSRAGTRVERSVAPLRFRC